MLRCLELASQAARTAPNPKVGSVAVKGDTVVGEGFHPGAGQPHAEVFALRQAGEQAKGATLYVNLEPCNHYGRTPPCTEAIIQAGVARVVIGMIDPDPRVSGGGIERLRQAGIEVIEGVETAACQRLNEAFVYRVLHQRPFGILKYAMTLDGKIAAASGHSAWVSSPESRRRVHLLRGQCDAVIVGGNTVRRDNPLLTAHGVGKADPLRVVMSRKLDLPKEAQLWQIDVVPTVVFTGPESDPEKREWLSQRVEVVALEDLSPDMVMANLYDRGCSTVLWECGGVLAAEAIAQQRVQKILAFIAPKLIGGDGLSPIGSLGRDRMDQALPVKQVRWLEVEPDNPNSDLLIEGYI
ncbi:bifunctional diaminohydroxyphosphoribosylaminopyrimidine deaminase/5-amino-6-(5-phosphoribosylamino)uracil reductase RibD [filamentous cyanobacterium CCP5]|nr:bifunctional diaminohydroxyphosphoribosylaminopyrimidine deaminase/5-amino-6-(5-phosphoribosylamino)uracil reductase RibD [filamentous cyanobacterium CCP5]